MTFPDEDGRSPAGLPFRAWFRRTPYTQTRYPCKIEGAEQRKRHYMYNLFFKFSLSSLRPDKRILLRKKRLPICIKVRLWYTLLLSILHGLLEILDRGWPGTAECCVLVVDVNQNTRICKFHADCLYREDVLDIIRSFYVIELLLVVRMKQEDHAPYMVVWGWYDSRPALRVDYPFPSPSLSDLAHPSPWEIWLLTSHLAWRCSCIHCQGIDHSFAFATCCYHIRRLGNRA